MARSQDDGGPSTGGRPNFSAGDVTVPVSKAPALADGIAEIMARYDLPYVVFGHAGDGNMHPKIMYDRNNPDKARRLEKAWEEILSLTAGFGGTISGEHGIGIAKAPYMHFEHDEVERDVMRLVKRALDPRNLMNPGKSTWNRIDLSAGCAHKRISRKTA